MKVKKYLKLALIILWKAVLIFGMYSISAATVGGTLEFLARRAETNPDSAAFCIVVAICLLVGLGCLMYAVASLITGKVGCRKPRQSPPDEGQGDCPPSLHPSEESAWPIVVNNVAQWSLLVILILGLVYLIGSCTVKYHGG